MATLGQIIDYALKNCGDADAGNDRDSLLIDLIDMLTVDLPAEIGGDLSEGFIEVNVGYTGTLSESGIYDIPERMRACAGALCFIDDVSISTPERVTPVLSENVFTMPDSFYTGLGSNYGPANSQNQYGQPNFVLIYGNQVHLRPIPKQTGDPLWFGKLVLFGSVSPQDWAGATENTVIQYAKIVPCLRAGATVLAAARERLPEVARMWSDIYSARKNELRAQRSMSISQPQNPASDY